MRRKKVIPQRLLEEHDRRQQRAFNSFSRQKKPMYRCYLGKRFVIQPKVFRPHPDAIMLIKKMRINPGDRLLDIGTGVGIIPIFALYKGALEAVGTDVSVFAARNARHNARLHDFEERFTVHHCDLFDKVEGKFDVITVNLPMREKKSSNAVESTMWDTDFRANRGFFQSARNYLKRGGRIYLLQSNVGSLDMVKKLARDANFRMRKIATQKVGWREYYVFELR